MMRASKGCGSNLIAVLFVYNDDMIYRIDFDGINAEMYCRNNFHSISEIYSKSFFSALQKLFNLYGNIQHGCNEK